MATLTIRQLDDRTDRKLDATAVSQARHSTRGCRTWPFFQIFVASQRCLVSARGRRQREAVVRRGGAWMDVRHTFGRPQCVCGGVGGARGRQACVVAVRHLYGELGTSTTARSIGWRRPERVRRRGCDVRRGQWVAGARGRHSVSTVCGVYS